MVKEEEMGEQFEDLKKVKELCKTDIGIYVTPSINRQRAEIK